MNLSPVFTFATKQQLKQWALKATIARCEAALKFIDYTLPIWTVAIQLFIAKAKRFFVRRAISVLQFSNYHGITAKVRKVWTAKGVIAIRTMDKVFSLN